jgi:uncharacterized protein (DUF697 family)/tellurite resistance protein
MTETEQKAILTISLMAAFADGGKQDQERAEIKRIAESLAGDTSINTSALYQDVLLKRRSLEQAVGDLQSPETRQLAYEMAVCVCDADEVASAAETAFLQKLTGLLGLQQQVAAEFSNSAAEIVSVPLATSSATTAAATNVDAAESDRMILNYSILNGALELLPQSLASVAIIPLQMKMVYRVGKAYGYELDRGHIKDLLATLGVGLTGQYVEQIGRKLLGGLMKKVGGGLLGGLGSAAVGVGASFATTYALGQVAKQYYSSGRTIDTAQLKQVFASTMAQAKQLQQKHAGDIQQKARTIDVSQIASMVRGQ